MLVFLASIRSTPLLKQYRRRGVNATFTIKNDHNPMVLQNCPRCRGTRKTCEYLGTGVIARVESPDGNGDGVTGELIETRRSSSVLPTNQHTSHLSGGY